MAATAGGGAAVAAASTQLGKPYKWAKPVRANTRNPDGFDCSGLTMWSWYQAGATIKLGHYTGTQWTQTAKRPLAQAQPGDLVFFGAGVPHHVALYVGNGQIIEAPDFGIPVRVSKINMSGDVRKSVGIFPGSNAATTVSGGTVATSPITTIYDYLSTTLGLSKAGDAAVLGNFNIESQLDPTATNPREGAIGLAQWEGGRRTKLQKYAAAHGGKETDLAMQLGYLGQELTGPYSGVLARLRKATDPATAAADFDQNFEGSSGAARTDRVNSATSIYQQIQAGTLTSSGGAATFSGGGSAAPYDPATLKAPLSTTQRTAIIVYLLAGGSGDFAAMNDAQLITAYRIAYSTRGATVSGPDLNPLDGVLSGVGPIVTKAAFTLAGLGLVLVGAAATVRSKGLLP